MTIPVLINLQTLIDEQKCYETVVKQSTIAPVIQKMVSLGTLIFTDEYSIYARLTQWGYRHKTVNHGQGEYARDEDGDGFYEVHINTMEGFWSLLRSRFATTPGNFPRQVAALFRFL